MSKTKIPHKCKNCKKQLYKREDISDGTEYKYWNGYWCLDCFDKLVKGEIKE